MQNQEWVVIGVIGVGILWLMNQTNPVNQANAAAQQANLQNLVNAQTGLAATQAELNAGVQVINTITGAITGG